MQKVLSRKYGVQTVVTFTLKDLGGDDFRVDAVHVSGDTKIMKNEGVEVNTTNSFIDEGIGYSIILTVTEMQSARIVVYIVDQTSPKAWRDIAINIETYGHSSAMHSFDFSTNDLQIDWSDGGRLDLLIDSILAATEIKTAAINDVGASTTKFITTLTEVTNDFWERSSFLWTSGNNKGIIRGIKHYNGSTKEIEVEAPLPFAPANEDRFVIITDRKYLSPDSYNVLYFDINGEAGTNYPVGIVREHPVNNVNDLLTIAANRGICDVSLYSDITIDNGHDISGMHISTHGIMGIDVTLNSGCITDNVVFRYLNLQGVLNSANTLLIENCSILNLSNFTGIMQNVTFLQGSEISIGTWAEIYNCRAGGNPGNEPEVSIGDSILNIQQYNGNLKLKDKTGDNRTVAGFLPGNVIIDSTCIAGKIQILGHGYVERNDSGPGCQVDLDAALTNEYIADHVWEHTDAEFMLKVIKNKKELTKVGLEWKLIIYDNNGTTEILNKVMKDKDGANISDLTAGVLAAEMANTA